MNNFIVLFKGREGTSPLIRLLNNFDTISIVHQIGNAGWEPFDRHNCGPMTLQDIEQCLSIIYGKKPVDLDRLNKIYMKTGLRPLENINTGGAVGFKMRFVPPETGRFQERGYMGQFKDMMFDVFKKHNVVVFISVRQDVMRWGLSKYHGDGTCNDGHLQFKLASGLISKDQISKMHVDCDRLEKIIRGYESEYSMKRALMEELKRANIRTYPILYEEFENDSHGIIKRVLELLELTVSSSEMDASLSRGAYFQKVHSNHVSDFVINSEEVLSRFGSRFIPW